ncbi:hypothetical protein CVT24_005064 [Panaeolus cyanescens]|uniref:Uncharacterized protein n=1 Tax=Panaeolus cyanescens TaxID=181874 RepID=A0A409VPK7_9AGAR|nr:hypothetical protein CVT24_005064 [Panaeolus cyanescens]
MSLPPAQKDISTHPGANAVTVPVDKQAKDADVQRKIKLYGIVQAFREGRLPSNAQIDSALSYVLSHSPVDVSSLSPEGQKLIQDVKDIIGTTRTMILDKNADELFQSFIWHTRSVDTSSVKDENLGELAPVDADKARGDKDQAVKHLRTLLNLVLTNSEARKLLSDFSVIGRDLLAITASKAGSSIAPSQDELRRVDQTAPNDQFITEGGRLAGPNETPVLEGRLPGTNKEVRHHPHEDDAYILNEDGSRKPVGEARREAQDTYREGRETYEGVKQQAVHQGMDAVRRPEKRDEIKGTAQEAKDTAQEQAREKQQEAENMSPEERQEKKGGMMGKVRQMRDGITDMIPQQHKDMARDNAKEYNERTRRFLSEDYFPEERRDQFIFRFKKVVLECQKHDDYQQSLTWLLDAFEEYLKHGRDVAQQGPDLAQHHAKQSNLDLCIAELRTLLERFANGQSMDIILSAMGALADDTKRDEALKEWFRAVNLYVRKVLLEPGYILEPDCNKHANRLRELGREFYDVKYRSHFDNLFDSVGTWFKAMGDDPINQQFGQDWARLTHHLLFNDEGNLQFKPELWNDIRKVILPTLIEEIGYVPIPRVEYTDDSLDLVVENLTLQGRNLFPNIVSFETNNYVKFSPYNAITDDHKHSMLLKLEHMQADMRDVAFYYRKKTGLPKMKDSGIADVLVGGSGISATIKLASVKHDKSSVFKVQHVDVRVDSLKFSIRDSKHDFLYKTLKPLATGLIKKQIQRAVEDALRTGLEYLDGQLVGVRDRMEEAKKNDGDNRATALKEIFARKKDEAASLKTNESRSQFKIVSDKRDSILRSHGHPAGWVNRTEEKKGEALKGEEWRSDAFTIVGNQKHGQGHNSGNTHTSKPVTSTAAPVTGAAHPSKATAHN